MALADDAIGAITLNPAGLARLGLFRADVGDMPTFSRDRYRNALNDSEDRYASYLIPSLGAAVDPRWGEPAETPFWIGVGAAGHHGTGGSKTVYTSIYPQGEDEALSFAVIRVGPAFGFSPAPGIRLGAGLFYNYATLDSKSAATSSGGQSKGRVRVHREPDGTPNNPPRDFLVNGQPVTWNDLFSLGSSPDSNSAALFKLDTGTTHGFSFNLGVQYDAADWLTLGLAYTSQSFFFGPIRGKASIDASSALAAIQSDPDIQSLIGPVLAAYLPNQASNFLANYDYELEGFGAPQTLSIGAAFFPTDEITLALDLRWMNYSAAYSTLHARLGKGTNPDINEINGSDGIEADVVSDWDDVFVIAAGASFSATEWLVLRLGYGFASDPLKHDLLNPGSTPYLQHHATGGFSIAIGDHVGAHAALVWALPRELEVGTYRNNPDFSNARLSAEQLFLYLGLSVDF